MLFWSLCMFLFAFPRQAVTQSFHTQSFVYAGKKKRLLEKCNDAVIEG